MLVVGFAVRGVFGILQAARVMRMLVNARCVLVGRRSCRLQPCIRIWNAEHGRKNIGAIAEQCSGQSRRGCAEEHCKENNARDSLPKCGREQESLPRRILQEV